MDIPEILEFENDMFGGDFNEKIQELEKVYSGIPDGKISDEVKKILNRFNFIFLMFQIMLSIAMARTVNSVDDGISEKLNESMLIKAIDNLDMVIKRRNQLAPSTAVKAARLAGLQAKLLTIRNQQRVKLYEKLGEFLYLDGRLMAAREAFLIGLRHEGNQDLRLSLLSTPSTVIKAVLSAAIEHEFFATGTCDGTNESDCQTNADIPMITKTKLNTIFWPDTIRSVVHEKLEWWLAKSKTMFPHFMSLENGIYDSGIRAGVYLSRYQRPINAIEGLRAKPVWTDKETGMKATLDKIRDNWQVIRDEGMELMKDKRLWGVDRGWQGMSGSRGWWGEVPIKGVALVGADQQTKFCKNALFTCR